MVQSYTSHEPHFDENFEVIFSASSQSMSAACFVARQMWKILKPPVPVVKLRTKGLWNKGGRSARLLSDNVLSLLCPRPKGWAGWVSACFSGMRVFQWDVCVCVSVGCVLSYINISFWFNGFIYSFISIYSQCSVIFWFFSDFFLVFVQFIDFSCDFMIFLNFHIFTIFFMIFDFFMIFRFLNIFYDCFRFFWIFVDFFYFIFYF